MSREGDAVIESLIAEMPEPIRGYWPSYEYPGYFQWTRLGQDPFLIATPEWADDDYIALQIADNYGTNYLQLEPDGYGALEQVRWTGNVDDDRDLYLYVVRAALLMLDRELGR